MTMRTRRSRRRGAASGECTMFTLPIALIAAAVYGVYAIFRKQPGRRARFLHREGVTLGLLTAALWLLFAFGEMFTDRPTGESWAWTAVAVLPCAVASWFAVRHPAGFRVGAFAIVGALAAATVVTLFLGDRWRAFVDKNGPVLVIACLVAAVPLMLWGMHQPGRAGGLLLGLGLIGMMSGPSVSGEALMSPLLVSGGILLLAGRTPPTTNQPEPPPGTDFSDPANQQHHLPRSAQ